MPSVIINHIITLARSDGRASSAKPCSDGIQNLFVSSARIRCALEIIKVKRSLHQDVIFIQLLTPLLNSATPDHLINFQYNLLSQFFPTLLTTTALCTVHRGKRAPTLSHAQARPLTLYYISTRPAFATAEPRK